MTFAFLVSTLVSFLCWGLVFPVVEEVVASFAKTAVADKRINNAVRKIAVNLEIKLLAVAVIIFTLTNRIKLCQLRSCKLNVVNPNFGVGS